MLYFHQKIDGRTLHVVSDLHFNHKNIVRGVSDWEGKRGTRDFNTIPEMNDAIFQSINDNVSQSDNLIIVGDFLFGVKSEIYNLRDRINCENVYLILGNHDEWLRKPQNEFYKDAFSGVFDYLELLVSDRTNKKRLVSFFHYPMKSWNDVNRGGMTLTGHEHGNMPYTNSEAGIDMSWEIHKRPLSFYEICDIIDKKEKKKIHHAGV